MNLQKGKLLFLPLLRSVLASLALPNSSLSLSGPKPSAHHSLSPCWKPPTAIALWPAPHSSGGHHCCTFTSREGHVTPRAALPTKGRPGSGKRS